MKTHGLRTTRIMNVPFANTNLKTLGKPMYESTNGKRMRTNIEMTHDLAEDIEAYVNQHPEMTISSFFREAARRQLQREEL